MYLSSSISIDLLARDPELDQLGESLGLHHRLSADQGRADLVRVQVGRVLRSTTIGVRARVRLASG
jgi:hypothetical protein